MHEEGAAGLGHEWVGSGGRREGATAQDAPGQACLTFKHHNMVVYLCLSAVEPSPTHVQDDAPALPQPLCRFLRFCQIFVAPLRFSRKPQLRKGNPEAHQWATNTNSIIFVFVLTPPSPLPFC